MILPNFYSGSKGGVHRMCLPINRTSSETYDRDFVVFSLGFGRIPMLH